MELFVINISEKENFSLHVEPLDTNATLKAKIQKLKGCFVLLI